MIEKKRCFTRRKFIKTAAGVTGASLVCGLGCLDDDENATSNANSQIEDEDFRNLTVFSPGAIGTLQLKNRIIRSATEEAYCEGGIPNTRFIDTMTNLAKGGAGLIISGIAMVAEDDSLPFLLAAFDDKFLPGLKQVRDNVRKADDTCKLFAQIGHTGHRYFGDTRIGPSDVSWPGDTKPMRALSVPEISDIADAFAAGARRFKEAGWDGIEIHGGHGYLISTFLSPYTNKRQDEYGGSVAGRVRILAEIMEKTRISAGSDFPIAIKLNSDDRGGLEPTDLEGGINKEIFIETAEELVKIGFDSIDVSGNNCSQNAVAVSRNPSYFLDAATALDVDIPVILTGGNRNLDSLNTILRTGEVDFFGISRPLIREPDLPNKWQRGQSGDAECINCNLCTELENLIMGLRCHQIT